MNFFLIVLLTMPTISLAQSSESALVKSIQVSDEDGSPLPTCAWKGDQETLLCWTKTVYSECYNGYFGYCMQSTKRDEFGNFGCSCVEK